MKSEELKQLFEENKNWSVQMTDKSYSATKEAINMFIASLCDDLKNEKSRYNNEISAEYQRYEEEKSRLERTFKSDEDARAENEKTDTNRWLNNYWELGVKQQINKRINDSKFSFNSEKLLSFILKLLSKNRTSAFTYGVNELKRAESDVDAQKKKVEELAAEVERRKKSYNTARTNYKLNEAKKIHNENKEKLNAESEQIKSKIADSYKSLIQEYFNDQKFENIFNLSKQLSSPPEKFSSSEQVKTNVFFGVRKFKAELLKDIDIKYVFEVFAGISNDYIEVTDNCIYVRLPYFRALEEGYSVFAECLDTDSAKNKSMLQAYTLKMLINMPIGQTRPVLLDIDNSTTFADFDSIGGQDIQRRGINTGQIIDADKIATAIKKVSDQLGEFNKSYGDNKNDIRMKNEPIYFVVAKSFPKGLNNESIMRIEEIIRNGALKGFFGMLMCDNGAIKLYEGNNQVMNSISVIRKNSLCIKEVSNGVYTVVGDSDEVLEFDTMDSYLSDEYKDNVLQTLTNDFSKYSRPKVLYEDLFTGYKTANRLDINDSRTWGSSNPNDEFSVPIALKGGNVEEFTFKNAHHALISGSTQYGKSSLLRSIITSAMIKYPPNTIQLYLIDFKEGVEFKVFADYKLPWIKRIVLQSQKEMAAKVVDEIFAEFKKRAQDMREVTKEHTNRMQEGRIPPRIIFIFDEIQEFIGIGDNDEDSKRALDCLSQLQAQGASYGINLIFASQNFALCGGMDAFLSNMNLHVAFFGRTESTSKLFDKPDDFDLGGEQGKAAISTEAGHVNTESLVHVGYLDIEVAKQYLSKLSENESNTKCETKIISSNPFDDMYNIYTRFVMDGFVEDKKLPGDNKYNLILGYSFEGFETKTPITLSAYDSSANGDNLIAWGDDSKIAESLFSFIIISLLYEELRFDGKRIDNELIRLSDFTSDYSLKYLQEALPRAINYGNCEDATALIRDTYDNLHGRMDGTVNKEERLFLILYGIDQYYELTNDSEIKNMIMDIIKNGPQYGINTIMWTSSYEFLIGSTDSQGLLSPNFVNAEMLKRLFFGESESSELEKVKSFIGGDVIDKVGTENAVMFKETNANHRHYVFYPYANYLNDWLGKFAETYNRLIDSKGEGE